MPSEPLQPDQKLYVASSLSALPKKPAHLLDYYFIDLSVSCNEITLLASF